MLANLLPNVQWETMWAATVETLYMTGVAVAATFVLGIVLGLLLFLTAKGNLWENRFVNTVIAAFVNIFRSIPFIILIILLIPFT
ncbi:methionine ABC transporter permease, partial [Geobacillus zalihae]